MGRYESVSDLESDTVMLHWGILTTVYLFHTALGHCYRPPTQPSNLRSSWNCQIHKIQDNFSYILQIIWDFYSTLNTSIVNSVRFTGG